MLAIRWLLAITCLVVMWQVVVILSGAPEYLLPPPSEVLGEFVREWPLLAAHFWVTAAEILIGLGLGTALGCSAALVIGHFRSARHWLLPILVASQAVPVFALAPLLVLWLGYGMASKVAMATLIIFFPVAAAFLDGLRRTEPGWIDLARTMTAAVNGKRSRSARLQILLHVRVPAALPALGSGLRVATAVAPIGAIVGEWVGSSAGLGHLMLQANARMKIDLMFAALFLLAVFSIAMWFTVDRLLRHWLPWHPDAFDRGDTMGREGRNSWTGMPLRHD